MMSSKTTTVANGLSQVATLRHTTLQRGALHMVLEVGSLGNNTRLSILCRAVMTKTIHVVPPMGRRSISVLVGTDTSAFTKIEFS
jgi:hypothetical protein